MKRKVAREKGQGGGNDLMAARKEVTQPVNHISICATTEHQHCWISSAPSPEVAKHITV